MLLESDDAPRVAATYNSRRLTSFHSLTAASAAADTAMPYDDDDDLFGEEFDFVDDDDDDTPIESSEAESESPADSKPRRPSGAGRGKPPARPPRGRAKPPAPARREPRRDEESAPPRRESRRDEEPEPLADPTASDFGDSLAAEDDEAVEAPAPEPTGPPADHVIHIYEYGKFKRTIPRKFTDEEAVGFAEEYTKTGKAYGRYAIATPDDEEPAQEFADAAKG